MPSSVQDLKRSCKNLHKKRLDTSLAGHYSKYAKTYADDDDDDDEDAGDDDDDYDDYDDDDEEEEEDYSVRCIDVCNSLSSFAS